MSTRKATRSAAAWAAGEPCEVGFLGRKTGLGAIKTTADNQSNENVGDYLHVVVVLNDRWRVIECHNGVQWIVQQRNRTETMVASRWRGRSYCRTREVLIRCCHSYCGNIDPAAQAVLASLPEAIGGAQ